LIPVSSEYDDVYEFWWSDDSETLFWAVRGQSEVQAFDIGERISRPALNPIYPTDELVPKDLASRIPDAVDPSDLALSPRGDKVVYGLRVLPQPTPGPTPTPNTEGIPSDVPEFEYNIYLIEAHVAEYQCVGTIDGQLAGFTWFPDETKAVIHTSVKAPGQAYEWLADFSTHSLSPLFPVDAESPPVRSGQISPDSQWILFSEAHGDHLYMRNVENGVERELVVAPPIHAWWLSNGYQLLLLGWDGEEESSERLFWYDLRTEELSYASDLTIKTALSPLLILAPDESKVAFMWEYSRQLFVITLCPES